MKNKDYFIIPGFKFSAACAGIKYKNRPDLGLILSNCPCNAAGVFTKNRLQAPAIIMDKQRLNKNGAAQAIIVNSGNANTCAGNTGMETSRQVTRALAKTLGIKSSLCLMSSTGVIGEPLPKNKIIDKVPELVKTAAAEKLPDLARAIMTTDTRPKTASREISLQGKSVKLSGVAKGSGMIMPDMATMLAYIMTDARIETPLLREMLRKAVKDSFNAVTVDGDTSTSDTVIMMAGGESGCDCKTQKARSELQHALDRVCLELAEEIAADGEGATRLVRIKVNHARTEKEADMVARRIANSPLVKTAIHAADPNWGRIMAAAGSAGVPLDMKRLSLRFQNKEGHHLKVAENCAMHPEYAEKKAEKILASKEVDIVLSLGRGDQQKTVLTCDLSSDYIKINAEYRS